MDVDGFRSLIGGAGADAAAQALAALDAGASTLSVAEGVRRNFPELPADVASLAVTQATLRRRARAKFGPVAEAMWFTRDGLEQATGTPIAAHRTQRFADLSTRLGRPARVADLCCGVGGDLLALAAAGCEVHGFDVDPATAEVAAANAVGARARASVECLDVEKLDLSEFDAAFIDPARRSNGRRTFDVEAYRPPWPFVVSVLTGVPAAAAKIAPGIAHELVPAGIEIEWISWGRGLKEAILWSGGFSTPRVRRRATVLPPGLSPSGGASLWSASAFDEEPVPVGAPLRYLYEPDDAVVRAHLVADLARRLDGVLLDSTTAYITSDTAVETPFAQVFEITDVMPFSLKRLRATLRTRDVGAVTIMKRASAVDVEQLRQALRLAGPNQAILVLALVDGRHSALLVTEAAPGSGNTG